MSVIERERLDVVVIGSGLTSLNFIEAYLSKKKKNSRNLTKFFH